MLQLSDADFQRLVTFMRDRYGINLSQKRLLINSQERMRRRLSLS